MMHPVETDERRDTVRVEQRRKLRRLGVFGTIAHQFLMGRNGGSITAQRQVLVGVQIGWTDRVVRVILESDTAAVLIARRLRAGILLVEHEGQIHVGGRREIERQAGRATHPHRRYGQERQNGQAGCQNRHTSFRCSHLISFSGSLCPHRYLLNTSDLPPPQPSPMGGGSAFPLVGGD